MKQNMPTGGKRLLWNLLMLIASGLATFGSIWSIKASKYPVAGFAALCIFVLAALVGSVMQGAAGPKQEQAAE